MMDDTVLQLAMHDSLNQTLEEMTFEAVDVAPEPLDTPTGKSLGWIKVQYTDDTTHEFRLFFEPDFVETLVNAILIDGEGDEQVICDTLSEIGNVFAGLMAEKMSQNQPFTIGLPESGLVMTEMKGKPRLSGTYQNMEGYRCRIDIL